MSAASTARQSVSSARVGFKRILIATDFSSYSSKALQYGLAIARGDHSKVCIANVVSSLGFAMSGPEAITQAVELGKVEACELRNRLRDGGFLEGVSAEVDVEFGADVADQLLEMSHKYDPDLVVLGTHGRTGLTKLWIGSIAERVFRSSQCPVLTVGPGAEWPETRHLPPLILFPTDFSPESVKALKGCIALAESKGTSLMLLHVAPIPRGEAAADKQRIISGLESRLRALLPADLASITPVRVEFGDVQSAICGVAQEEGCSLIVMGLHCGRGVLAGRWQHAYGVVATATCPVLTVRTLPD